MSRSRIDINTSLAEPVDRASWPDTSTHREATNRITEIQLPSGFDIHSAIRAWMASVRVTNEFICWLERRNDDWTFRSKVIYSPHKRQNWIKAVVANSSVKVASISCWIDSFVCVLAREELSSERVGRMSWAWSNGWIWFNVSNLRYMANLTNYG